MDVPAGGTSTVSVVFAWRLPNRLYVGEELGNYYAALSPSAVTTAMAVASSLDDIVADASAWNKVNICNYTHARMYTHL